MRTKIETKNADKIEASLPEVNGRAEARTITSASEMISFANRVENDLLARALPKSHQKGVKADYTPGATGYARSYRGNIISTTLSIERAATGFFLTDFVRKEIYPNQGETFTISISKEQASTIKSNAIKGLNVG
ncbi:MAG: hypothetical protein V7695_19615 [Sulfitobacter sp.]